MEAREQADAQRRCHVKVGEKVRMEDHCYSGRQLTNGRKAEVLEIRGGGNRRDEMIEVKVRLLGTKPSDTGETGQENVELWTTAGKLRRILPLVPKKKTCK